MPISQHEPVSIPPPASPARRSPHPPPLPPVLSSEVGVGLGGLLLGLGVSTLGRGAAHVTSLLHDQALLFADTDTGRRVAARLDPLLTPIAQASAALTVDDSMRNLILAGTLARTMSQVIVHPIDTIKTRLQVKTPVEKLMRWRTKIKAQTFSVSLAGRQMGKVQNVLYRGPRDIYLGVSGAAVATLGVGYLYFTTYHLVKREMEKRLRGTPYESSAPHVVSASAGAMVSAVLRVPGDTVKHCVQAYLYPNCWVGLRDIVTENGLKGLYRGFGPTLIRDVPEIAIQFTLYEALRRAVVERRGSSRLTTYEHLLLGGVAGSVAATCTMPLDYIKTVVQCGRREGILQVLIGTLKTEGLGGLFKGMPARVSMTATMSACFFGLVEIWRQILEPEQEVGGRRSRSKR